MGMIGSAWIVERSTDWSIASSISPIRTLGGIMSECREQRVKLTYTISPLTRYRPNGISSTPSSMLYTRSLDSERTTFDFWSKPAMIPYHIAGTDVRLGKRNKDKRERAYDDCAAILEDEEDAA
jgi:hypothetical protein